VLVVNSIPYHKEGVNVREGIPEEVTNILSTDTLNFIARLERQFGDRRKALLRKRYEKQIELNSGKTPNFLNETRELRNTYWRAAAIPEILNDRRVECIGPPGATTMVDAMNSDANVFVADFEDSCSPLWKNILQGHSNIFNAIRGMLHYTDEEGQVHAREKRTVKLMVCPRGLHAEEKHIMVDRKPVSASLFDFGLFLFNNIQELLSQGMQPYMYIPKIENHFEARFWNDVFMMAEDEFNIPHGTIKATVIVESIGAAFEMHEILYELRYYCIGMKCGWQNYLFDYIKKLRYHHDFIIPDRTRLSTSTHFLNSLAVLLIQTCHKRGVHAIAGLSFELPVGSGGVENEEKMIKTRVEKERHADNGFDGTTVIYPYALSIARSAFSESMYQPNQLLRKRDDMEITAGDLLTIHGGQVNESGVRSNAAVALEYLAGWLSGSGITVRRDVIADAAVMEIVRTQLWQWMHNQRLRYVEGQRLTEEFYRKVVNEELKRLISFEKRKESISQYTTAKIILDLLVLDSSFTDFFTIPAYEHID